MIRLNLLLTPSENEVLQDVLDHVRSFGIGSHAHDIYLQPRDGSRRWMTFCDMADKVEDQQRLDDMQRLIDAEEEDAREVIQ